MEKFAIIAITKTRIYMTSKDFLLELYIEGYNTFHKEREGRRGTGLFFFFFVNDSL